MSLSIRSPSQIEILKTKNSFDTEKKIKYYVVRISAKITAKS